LASSIVCWETPEEEPRIFQDHAKSIYREADPWADHSVQEKAFGREAKKRTTIRATAFMRTAFARFCL
jgi:hypothetical protein